MHRFIECGSSGNDEEKESGSDHSENTGNLSNTRQVGLGMRAKCDRERKRQYEGLKWIGCRQLAGVGSLSYELELALSQRRPTLRHKTAQTAPETMPGTRKAAAMRA